MTQPSRRPDQPSEPHPPAPDLRPLLTMRAALIMFLGLFCGGTAAVLTMLAGAGAAAATLAGAAATAGAIEFFSAIIGA